MKILVFHKYMTIKKTKRDVIIRENFLSKRIDCITHQDRKKIDVGPVRDTLRADEGARLRGWAWSRAWAWEGVVAWAYDRRRRGRRVVTLVSGWGRWGGGGGGGRGGGTWLDPVDAFQFPHDFVSRQPPRPPRRARRVFGRLRLVLLGLGASFLPSPRPALLFFIFGFLFSVLRLLFSVFLSRFASLFPDLPRPLVPEGVSEVQGVVEMVLRLSHDVERFVFVSLDVPTPHALGPCGRSCRLVLRLTFKTFRRCFVEVLWVRLSRYPDGGLRSGAG